MMSDSKEFETSIETDRDKPLMVSSLSTFSMVMGMASCLLLVLVVPAVATAILAIIFGHISAAHVRANKVELLGLGRSRIGLMLGYLCLAVAAFLFPQMELRTGLRPPKMWRSSVTGYWVIMRGRSSGTASQVTAMVLLRAIWRKASYGKGLSWDGSRLRCHCYVNSGVVFIVRERNLAGFNDAALEVLALSAWRVASETVRNSGEFEADFPIAICVMGKRRCQTFVMGQAVNVDETLQEPSYVGPDSTEVLALFQ